MPDAQTVYLLIDESGALKRVAFSETRSLVLSAEEERCDVCEWPIKPLRIIRSVNSHGERIQYATEHISTDTAELGKLTSLDTLLEIALAVRGRDGWECVGMLPGLFGQNAYPPGLTVVWKRKGETG